MKFKLDTAQTSKDTATSKAYDPKKLNKDVLTELRKHMDLVKMLDKWILSPDKKLLPHIAKLAGVVDSLYSYDKVVMYRGFSLFGGYQNDMGLSEKSWFGKKLKACVKPGYKFDYDQTNPTSWTWDEGIAKGFGNIVVTAQMPKTGRLVIVNELSHLVSELRNLKDCQTQCEIITFGSMKIPTTVVKC